ncbi:MAG: Rho termination factor [Nostocaceae cyanobacterium CSU_2_110]|nr:Rho termination factor [Nostocaceae cyanobacterium CSU_2_110]
MSNLSDIGNLMYLDLAVIEPGEVTKASEYLINATAKQLSNNNNIRNWIPLVVKEIAEDRYQVIGNSFIYAVAEAAGLEKVWCIIADNSEKTAEITKILAGEAIPKINLSTASRDEIKAALEYLVEQPSTVLKGVKIPVATNRIDEALRQEWKNLNPITKLKCGITAGKKIKALEQVFYLTPKSESERKPANSKKTQDDLSKLTITELKKIAKERKISGYSKLNKSQLIKLLT